MEIEAPKSKIVEDSKTPRSNKRKAASTESNDDIEGDQPSKSKKTKTKKGWIQF
jgi:hypothetical protein